jgi:hypothetical protein
MSERLILKDTKLVKRTMYPGEDGCSQVLSIRSLLTRPLAEQLKCHDNCFSENGKLHQYQLNCGRHLWKRLHHGRKLRRHPARYRGSIPDQRQHGHRFCICSQARSHRVEADLLHVSGGE